MQGPSTDLEPVLPTGQRTWHPAGKKELPVPFTAAEGPFLAHGRPKGSCKGQVGLRRHAWLNRRPRRVRQAIARLQATLKGCKEPLPGRKARLRSDFSTYLPVLVHNFGGIAGTTARLSTAKGGSRLLSPLARQQEPRAAHRVQRHASACQDREKCTCPHKMPRSTTTTMYL